MEKINYEVIEVKPENWEKFKDIRTRAIMDSPQAFGDNLEETYARQKDEWISWVTRPKVYVIQDNEVYVATATLRQNPTTEIWTINGVWTDPKFRGKGLSRKIIEKIFEDARLMNVESIELSVNAEQIPAIKLYESLGFETVQEIPNVMMGDGNEYNEIEMMKRL
jgi:ribosomal protein S18 acetylase RimI-like enzyme